MHDADIHLFYKLHPALLQYVNKRQGLFPDFETPEALRGAGVETVSQVRDKLWGDIAVIDDFISENPYDFSQEELVEVKSWKNVIRGTFYVFRHLKQYSIFLTEKDPTDAYGVCSLVDPLEEKFWNLPTRVEAALLPFRGRVIYDGILRMYPITFGGGFRADLNDYYREAKKRRGIIETLV